MDRLRRDRRARPDLRHPRPRRSGGAGEEAGGLRGGRGPGGRPVGDADAALLEGEDRQPLVAGLGDRGDRGSFEAAPEALEGVEVGVGAEPPHPGSATAAAGRSWAAAPSSPVSANPEANTTAERALAAAGSSTTGSGSPTGMTATSTCSGRSATEGERGMPKTAGGADAPGAAGRRPV